MDKFPVDIIWFWGRFDEEFLIVPRKVLMCKVGCSSAIEETTQTFCEGMLIILNHTILHILIIEWDECNAWEVLVGFNVLIFLMMYLFFDFFDFLIYFFDFGMIKQVALMHFKKTKYVQYLYCLIVDFFFSINLSNCFSFSTISSMS